MHRPSFRDRLSGEFETRRKKNARYSLRAFAMFLGGDHSTLSQVLRGTRRIPASRIRSWATKLGIDEEEIAVYIAAELMPETTISERQEQMRHWTAEAISLLSERVHWQILRLSRKPGFRADCRWIAEQAGVTVDQVNIALARLLRLRLLEANSAGNWTDLTGLPQSTEREFRRMALARIREHAAIESDVK